MPKPAAHEIGPSRGILLVAVADDRRTALVARQARQGDRGSFHAVVLRADALPLVLVEVGVPVTHERWEYRSSGLWVEAVCEDPGVHWSYGLEAFALAIEHGDRVGRYDELLGKGYGHRTPLGWELDFTTDPTRTIGADDEPGADAADPAIEVGRVDGLLLTAPTEGGEMPFAGEAWRASWTLLSPDPWPVELAPPAGDPIEVALPLDGVDGGGPVWWVGHDGHSLGSRWSDGVTGG